MRPIHPLPARVRDRHLDGGGGDVGDCAELLMKVLELLLYLYDERGGELRDLLEVRLRIPVQQLVDRRDAGLRHESDVDTEGGEVLGCPYAEIKDGGHQHDGEADRVRRTGATVSPMWASVAAAE